MKPRFQTPRNFTFGIRHRTKVSPLTDTVPDQNFTIEEILRRFTRGADPFLTKIPQYVEEEEEFEGAPVNIVSDFTDIDEANHYISSMNELIRSRLKEKELREKTEKENKQTT